MPTPEFGSMGDNPSLSDVVDYVHKLQKELNYLLSSLDTLNINRLDAKVVKAGTLDANLVTVKSKLSGTSYLQIDGLGIRANNGTINTFEIDSTGAAYFRGNVTSDANITGANIRTALTGRRIELANNQLNAYDSGGHSRIQFYEDTRADYYELRFNDATGTHAGTISGTSSQLNILPGSGLSAKVVIAGPVYISSNSEFIMQTSTKMTFQSGSTIQGLKTDTVADHNHGIPSGTVLATAGGGTVTFVSSGGHSHNVTT